MSWNRHLRSTTLLLASLALVAGQSAQAECIEEQVANAARLHEFQMLMMNINLRCTRIGVEITPHYEAMLATHQARFDEAVRRLQHYFALTAGHETKHGGMYDRYATLIANRYGNGNTSTDRCREFDVVALAVVSGDDPGQMLMGVVKLLIEHPLLEQATCPLP